VIDETQSSSAETVLTRSATRGIRLLRSETQVLVSIRNTKELFDFGAHRFCGLAGNVREVRRRAHKSDESLYPIVDRRKNHSISILSCVHVCTLETKFFWQSHGLTASIHEQRRFLQRRLALAFRRFIARLIDRALSPLSSRLLIHPAVLMVDIYQNIDALEARHKFLDGNNGGIFCVIIPRHL